MPETFDYLPSLQGPLLSLRPATSDDLEALYAAASDPLIWALHPDPERYRRDVFERNFFAPAMAGTGALMVIDRTSGVIVGSSRYYEWDPEAEEVAIGYTFLARSHWGGAFNRELKALMLRHAFRFARRVWFHIGVHNLRSRRAMEKIGGRLSHVEARDQNGSPVENCYYFIDRDDPGIFA
jgi:RimJ/RimL family protein N-acetyltransferase